MEDASAVDPRLVLERMVLMEPTMLTFRSKMLGGSRCSLKKKGWRLENIKGGGQAIDGKGKPEKKMASNPDKFVFESYDGPTEYRETYANEKFKKAAAGKNFYELTLKNKGGLVTPLLIEWTYTDGSTEMQTVPAEVWRMNENEVTKVFVKDKEVAKVVN